MRYWLSIGTFQLFGRFPVYLISCILSNMSNGEVIKYHKFISVVVIELSVRCLNTGPEDRLFFARKDIPCRVRIRRLDNIADR